MVSETDLVVQRYDRRRGQNLGDRYSPTNWDVLMAFQERQRALLRFLREADATPAQMKVLEIGCGGGRNLLELILLGFKPANLVGIELLADRVRQARASLPDLVRILEGDACSMGFADGSFDVVLQSTVFTSILDDSFQQRLANEMWRCVAPGGAVLWYDFTFNNPSNPDVRGVPVRRVAQLFPEGNMRVRRVTLAPPLSRRVCRRFPLGYQSLNLIPWLRSHVLCWIGKTPR